MFPLWFIKFDIPFKDKLGNKDSNNDKEKENKKKNKQKEDNIIISPIKRINPPVRKL